MNVGSLFSGIGGLDLGLERAGMTVRWQSEIDPYASCVLAKHWPHVPNLGDVTLIDWSRVEPVDLICGGYPCQPFSLAGVRRGGSDPRHLWPYFHRAIRHLRPRYALLENVPGHLSMGFDRVLGDLAEIGYDVEWCSVPAAAMGAPHLRWRIFAVAYPHELQHKGGSSQVRRPTTADVPAESERHELRQQPVPIFRSGRPTVAQPDGPHGEMADTNSGRRRQRDTGQRRVPIAHAGSHVAMADPEGERRCPLREIGTTHPRPDTLPRHAGEPPRSHTWTVEPDVGRVAHGVPNRVDRLRCLGNAVVPQVAEWIGRRIMEAAA